MTNLVLIFIITLIILSASKGLSKNKSEKENINRPQFQNRAINKSSDFDEAYKLWREGNTQKALLLLKSSHLHDVSSLILLGEIYYELKEYEMATAAYQKSLKYSKTAFAYSRLGEIYELNELYNEAIKVFKKALKFNDVQKGFIYHKLGNLYMYTGAEELSGLYFEKAEKCHKEGYSTKLRYDDSKKTKSSPKNISVVIVVVVLFTLLLGVGIYASVMYATFSSQELNDDAIFIVEETIEVIEE